MPNAPYGTTFCEGSPGSGKQKCVFIKLSMSDVNVPRRVKTEVFETRVSPSINSFAA